MRVYHGERTNEGCRVTVDGAPLRVRSDLSGAIAPFDWGYVGNGQLSLALLADLLGDAQTAKALCRSFERGVVAELPHDSWTLTDNQFAAALKALAGADAATATAGDTSAGAASACVARVGFGDVPVHTDLVPDSERSPQAPDDATKPAVGGERVANVAFGDMPMVGGAEAEGGG